MGPKPDYSRAALARFIDYVVDKGLVNPSTAQGWRVATAKVLDALAQEEEADVRRIDVDATFKHFLNRHPGRLSPASTGEYRRRVGRAIEEFVSWMENPAGYGTRSAAWATRAESRPRGRAAGPAPRVPEIRPDAAAGISLAFPLRPGFLAQVLVPPDLTVDEARRMGAFLLTLAPDFRPEGTVQRLG
ncbi:MAG: hypothetical protein H0T68_12555 [Gemmatimonadales bacterium]|nr:hypothetical protein [Gemmatimonadales bacterium]